MFVKRLSLIVMALGLAVTVTGCGSATPPVAPHAAKAEAATAFTESAKAGDMDVTLTVDPLKVGENRIIVTVSDPTVKAVEAQVIMATMGHGRVLDLEQAAPGRFEIKTSTIEMEGRWMIRVKATPATGEAKDTTFHLVVK